MEMFIAVIILMPYTVQEKNNEIPEKLSDENFTSDSNKWLTLQEQVMRYGSYWKENIFVNM